MRRFRRRPDPHLGAPGPATLKLTIACAAAILGGWLLVARGPYGGAMSPGAAAGAIALRVLIIAIPLVALVVLWKRLRPRSRNVAGLTVGMLVVALSLFAVAEVAVLRERVRMRTDAATLAAEAFRDGDRRFLAVEDPQAGLVIPGIRNRCVYERQGTRLIAGTGVASTKRHRAYRERAEARALEYNRVIADRLQVPQEVRERVVQGACPAERG